MSRCAAECAVEGTVETTRVRVSMVFDSSVRGRNEQPAIRAGRAPLCRFQLPLANPRLAEQSRLTAWLFHPKMLVSERGGDASARSAIQQAQLHQVGLVNFLDRIFLFAQ
jgi:hypothetical protein